MGCVTLHRRFDIARPTAQRGSSQDLSQGSLLPQPREALVPPPVSRGLLSRWLCGFASLAQMRSQRVFSSSLLSADRAARGREDVPSTRLALEAMARTVAAVRAGQSIADPRCPTGDLRPT